MDFPVLVADSEVGVFLRAESRAATAEEADLVEGPNGEADPVFVYETTVEEGRRIKFLYMESFRYVLAELHEGERVVNSCWLVGPSVLLETDARPRLILFSESEVLKLGRDPWSLSVSNESFYMNRDWTSGEPW